MKRFALAALAAGSALTAATPASAAILIGVSINGGAITTVANDGGTGSTNYNTTTGGFFYNVSATGFPLLTMPQLLTQSVNIMSTGGAASTIDIYITQTDLTSLGGGLLSTFTTNTISGANATLRSYFSSTDQQFAGTLLQTANFTSGPTTFSGGNALTASGMFSETVRYTLNFTGGQGSNFNGTANLGAVPEAATWGMMILGFGVMGGMMRRRKTSVSFA